MLAERIITASGIAASAVSFDPSMHKGWTLPTFAVALVIYLLWKGERVEKEQKQWREEHLNATHKMEQSLEKLANAIKETRSG